jgi:hypothetical protein
MVSGDIGITSSMSPDTMLELEAWAEQIGRISKWGYLE